MYVVKGDGHSWSFLTDGFDLFVVNLFSSRPISCHLPLRANEVKALGDVYPRAEKHPLASGNHRLSIIHHSETVSACSRRQIIPMIDERSG